MSLAPLAVVVGVGVGIGGEVAKKFAREGYRVAICARNQTYSSADKLKPLTNAIQKEGGVALPYVLDAADPDSVSKVFDQLGEVDVLVYNAGARDFAPVLVEDTSPEKFLNYWKVNCYGAFLCSRAVLPSMKLRKKGSIFFTGATAAVRGSFGVSSFSPGKFGLRSLSQTLAAEAGPHNIHVCHFIIDGPVNIPILRKYVGQTEEGKERLIDPCAVADLYWNVYNQPRNCWTQELDVRSYTEPLGSKM